MQYNRRKFIKTLVVTAGAVMTSNLMGCNDSDDEVDVEALSTGPSTILGSQFFPQSVVSGDPKPDSVILWTRVEDGVDVDIALTLQVSLDESFSQLVVEEAFTTLAVADNCLKVRVTELNAGQHYYYRFVYQKDGMNYLSKNGRTKTAPSLDSDTKVKFAYVSCQDYIGRYYNTYLSVLDNDDLDFVVHLGDYIYETTGDPLFQESTNDRSITFNDSENVLTIGVGDKTTQAANSLDNYRQLYKEYRSDELLQKVHERFPMIAIWDDHEFSDDSWTDRATYLDGAADEQQTQRKKNSEMAYFEYMPIDHQQPHTQGELASGEIAIDDSHLYPNTRIYRDFHFGQHLHLAMTDFRTNRPDHILPEDAFPAAVELDQATLSGFLLATGMVQAQVDGVVAQMSPYINIDDAMFSPYKAAFLEVFTGLYTQEILARVAMDETQAFTQGRARAVAAVQGNLATSYLNQVLTQAKASLPNEHVIQQLPALPEQGVEQGLAFYTLGKTSLFNYLGSRYFVIKDTYDLYAGYKEYVAQLQGSSVQGGFDDQQTAWLGQTFATSTSTWKVLASSVSFSPLMFDFSSSRADSNIVPLEFVLGSELIPADLKQRFYLEADQWDGFPQYKANFVDNVMSQYGVISIGGDVHSAYITEHKANEVTGLKSFNFTTSSVSSGTFGSFLKNGMNTILGQLGDIPPEVEQLPLF
ncbi:MAG: alkaline phosphatase D family protein, partial [Colwellia sp.]|nr:alkaline phosphatase D family protein [Colwellia sp.]